MDKLEIRALAIKTANTIGLVNLSRKELCDLAGIKDGSFLNVMGCSFGELVHDIADEIDPEAKKMPVSKRRADPELRKDLILEAAITAALDKGYREISRGDVAKLADVSDGLVVYYFGSIDALRERVMVEAVEREIPGLIAQGLVANDTTARNAPRELRFKAIQYLSDLQ